jgi:hypothetical protein
MSGASAHPPAIDEGEFQAWLAASGIEGWRRVARVTERQVLVSKFEPGFFDRLDAALQMLPELFDAAAVRRAYRHAAEALAPSRAEAWRLGMAALASAAETRGAIDARQRAEVMAGVDSVAALLAGVTWTDPGPQHAWAPSAGEAAALADLRDRLAPDGRLFIREYGTFAHRRVVNHCPGARYARQFFEIACALCYGSE